jgi:GT2 family glycosyltransferase
MGDSGSDILSPERRPSGAAPEVSVLLATHNRRQALGRALRSLSALEPGPPAWELVVVDDGSSDATARVVEEAQGLMPGRLRCQRLDPQHGLSAARNTAMALARGSVFAFVDDDCLVSPDWLRRLVAPLRDPAVGLVGGPDAAPPGAPFTGRCVDFLLTSFIGTGGLGGGTYWRVGRYYPRGCNMAVRREAAERVGGFDERLRMGEEIDFGYRLEQAGLHSVYVPEARVWHERRASLLQHLRRVFQIGATRVTLARKHPRISQFGHLTPLLCLACVWWLLALGAVFRPARWLLAVSAVLYALLLIAAGIHAGVRLRDVRAVFVVVPLAALHHLAHALGFLTAGVRLLFGRPRPPAASPPGGAVPASSVGRTGQS